MKPILEAIQKRWEEYQSEINHQVTIGCINRVDLNKLPRVRELVTLCCAMELRLAEFWQNFDHQFPKPE